MSIFVHVYHKRDEKFCTKNPIKCQQIVIPCATKADKTKRDKIKASVFRKEFHREQYGTSRVLPGVPDRARRNAVDGMVPDHDL